MSNIGWIILIGSVWGWGIRGVLYLRALQRQHQAVAETVQECLLTITVLQAHLERLTAQANLPELPPH